MRSMVEGAAAYAGLWFRLERNQLGHFEPSGRPLHRL